MPPKSLRVLRNDPEYAIRGHCAISRFVLKVSWGVVYIRLYDTMIIINERMKPGDQVHSKQIASGKRLMRRCLAPHLTVNRQ